MRTPVKTNRLLLMVGLDISLTLLSLWLATQLRAWLPLGRPLGERGAALEWPIYVLAALIWVTTFSQFDLYTRRRTRFRQEARAVTAASLTALLILAGALYLSFRQVSRLQFLYFGALNVVSLNAAHALLFARRRAGEPWRVLIVGASQPGRELAERLSASAAGEVVVVGFLDDQRAVGSEVCPGLRVLGQTDQVVPMASELAICEVVLALPRDAQSRALALIAELEPLPVQVSLVPDVLDLAWFMTRVEDLNGIPILRLRESPLDGPARAVKRVMDLVVSAGLLITCGPLMLLIAILIKLDSPGPAIIRQQRVGESGRLFEMLKFRTMRAGEEQRVPKLIEGLHKRPRDPRVTRLGRFLRRYSLDELPQLINVLKGEMSLVGPRPELPWLVERYESWQRRRFAVPPGMTGWWQVNGRSERPMHLHVEDDLYYIRNYSLWMDLVILLRTVPAVLSGRGAF